jgi:AraC-like DNA-binding protein
VSRYNDGMRSRPLPESCSCLTPWFAGADFAISDWRCAGHDTQGREDEWCDADRVVVTRRGVYEWSASGKPQVVDATTVTFWAAHSYYRVSHPVAGGDDCTVFRLSDAGSAALRERHRGRRCGAFARHAQPLDGRGYLLHRIAFERARQGLDALSIEEPVFALLDALVPDAYAPAARAGITPAAREQVAYVQHRLALEFRDRLSLATLAEGAGCSPFHLSRRFRSVTGMSVHRVLVRTRLRAALEQLLDRPERLADLALECGFASHSHFTDAFRAEYGCAPTEARRLVQA